MSLGIAFIGYGEVGQLFARQLAAKPGVSMAATTSCSRIPSKGRELSQHAPRCRRPAAAGLRRSCRGSRIVISAVTADAAVAVAREAGASLTVSQIYIDLNSISPATKRIAAEEVRPRGAEFRRIRRRWRPVGGPGIAVPILAGGSQARGGRRVPQPARHGDHTGQPEIGVASATKLCRSIVIKGMEALMVDFNLAAEKAGVLPAVIEKSPPPPIQAWIGRTWLGSCPRA